MKIVVVFMLLVTAQCSAQQTEENLNRLYEKFARSYEHLDANSLSDLYTANGEIINLYNDRVPNTLKGHREIREYFDAFFERCESNDQQLLSFKIMDRRKAKRHYLDNGFYKLEFVMPSGPSVLSYGRFSIVLAHANNGWKFRTDANTNADSTEYESAVSIPV